MAEESDIVGFLKTRDGQASLEEIAMELNIPKYGPNSAYALLHTLREKGIVDRKGEKWVLLVQESAISNIEASESSEKRESATLTVDRIVEAMAKTLKETMKDIKEQSEESQLTTKPSKTEVERREEVLNSRVLQPDEASEAKKQLIGLATGTFLDDLFFDFENKVLGGIPICGQFTITGLPGAGKSILVEEIAIRVASSGRKVLFITAEDAWKSPTPRFDLQSRMKQKADLLELDWNNIRENLLILDTVSYPELRDWNTFAETYRYVIEKEKNELAIIDSVTFLEANKDALKYRVLELARYNQIKGVTGLFVNQRNAENHDTYDMAGGISLAYNFDGTIIIDYGRIIYWPDQQVDLNNKRGEFVRIAKVLNCRLCNFERRRIQIDITPEGFLRTIKLG